MINNEIGVACICFVEFRRVGGITFEAGGLDNKAPILLEDFIACHVTVWLSDFPLCDVFDSANNTCKHISGLRGGRHRGPSDT